MLAIAFATWALLSIDLSGYSAEGIAGGFILFAVAGSLLAIPVVEIVRDIRDGIREHRQSIRKAGRSRYSYRPTAHPVDSAGRRRRFYCICLFSVREE